MKHLMIIVFLAHLTIPFGPKEDYTGIDLTIDNGAYILKLADGGRVYLPVQWTVIQVIDGSVADTKKKRK